MKRRAFLQASAAALAYAKLSPAFAFALEQQLIGPYLQNVTENQAIVCWLGDGELEFGIENQISKLELMLDRVKINKALIEGLQPGREYNYAVSGREGKFTTVQEGPFSFIVVGDTQEKRESRRKIVAAMKELSPHFYIHVGDAVEDGRELRQWLDFLEDYEPLMANAPLYTVLGNHERDSLNYFQLFCNPRYYSFERGKCRFVFLDSNHLLSRAENEHKKKQISFLEQLDNTKINILAFHHPLYSACEERHNEYIRMRKALKEKFIDINLVFSGHDHNYQRLERRGMTQIVTGGGGGWLYGGFKLVTGLRKAKVQNHFIYVEADKNLLLYAINSDGKVIDLFKIDK